MSQAYMRNPELTAIAAPLQLGDLVVQAATSKRAVGHAIARDSPAGLSSHRADGRALRANAGARHREAWHLRAGALAG